MTRRRLTKAKIESFLKGEYMKVKPNSKMRLYEKRVLLATPYVVLLMVLSVLLAKIPMKMMAMTSKIRTITANITPN